MTVEEKDLLAEYGQLSIDIELAQIQLEALVKQRREVYQSIQAIKTTPKKTAVEPSKT